MTKNVGATFDDTDVNARRTIANGPTTVRAIAVTSTDSATRVIRLYHFDGTNERSLGAVDIPIDAGVDGTEPGVDLLNEVDSPWVEVDERGNNVVVLGGGESLRVGVTMALTAGKFVYVTAFGGDE